MERILHVVSSLNINSGVMSVIMNYYRRIDRSKIQFDFLYMEQMAESHEKEIVEMGGKTFYLPYPSFKPSDQKRLRLFFTEHASEYKIVHCHPIWAALLISRAAKRSGVKHIIQHSHSTKFSDSKKSEVRNRILMKFVGMCATEYIACSPEAAYLFGKRRAENGIVTVLNNAIDLELYKYDSTQREAARKEFQCASDTILIGNVGRLCPQKNQGFVLDVFQEIHQIVPSAKLLIVGEGSLREELEKKIEALNLSEYVIMTGKRRDIKAILSALDIFLMPSLFEGAPVSAIEARTSGLPCVLSDTITKSVSMEGITFISLKESPTVWAKKTIDYYMSRNGFDRTDCSEIINHGFDISQTVKQLQCFYLNL